MSGFGELAYAREIMKAGFSPFWNPYLSCGTPLFGQFGLALGYPGILLALLIPGQSGQFIFLALHVAWSYFGFKLLARRWASRVNPDLAGLFFSALSLALGCFFQPAFSAAIAWIPWTILAETEAGAFASWAMLLSCAEPFSAAVAVALSWNHTRRRVLVAAFLAAAMAIVPAIQAFTLTRSVTPGFPSMNASDALMLKAEARQSRVYFEPKSSKAVSTSPVIGPLWIGGARRPVAWVAESMWGLSGDGGDSQLCLRGTSVVVSDDGQTRSSRRLQAPFRAAFVSSAGYSAQAAELLKAQAKPFLTRPLILNQAHDLARNFEGAGLWTLLSMESNAAGDMSAELPSSHEAGWFYLSDAFYPGWTALVDGKSVPILRAEGSFRALHLDSGAKNVAFRYRPWLIYGSWLISLLALVFTLSKPDILRGIR